MPWISSKSSRSKGGISVKRLTEKHYNSGDHYMLGYIEDILGNDYDLDRLREIVENDRRRRQ